MNCWETGGHDLGECVGFLEGTTLRTDLLNVFKIHDMTRAVVVTVLHTDGHEL